MTLAPGDRLGAYEILSPLGAGGMGEEERELSWLDASMPADLSADGSTLLLTEQGEGSGKAPAVYLRGTDGSPAVRLGEGVGLSLSPDKKKVLAKLEPGQRRPASLLLMPTGPGRVETLKTGSFASFGWGGFLPDGRRILFSATGSNGVARIDLLDPSGGAPRSIGPEGVSLWPFASAVSPDGQFVLGRRASTEGGPGLPVVIPLDGGEPRAIPDWSGGLPVQWAAGSRALYVYFPPRREVRLVDVETGKTKLWREFPAAPAAAPVPRRFRITPDGRAYVYTTPRVFSALYLLEGLR